MVFLFLLLMLLVVVAGLVLSLFLFSFSLLFFLFAPSHLGMVLIVSKSRTVLVSEGLFVCLLVA